MQPAAPDPRLRAEEAELRERLDAAAVPAEAAARLATYGALVLDANRRMNLTGAKTAAALVEHLLDALTLAGDVRGPLVDVGAGAGLPGIPLGIVTGARIVLVESAVKKARFLTQAVTRLGLDAEVVAMRAESAARDERYRERFASATARAVGTAPTVAELTLPFLVVGGRALLQRGALAPSEKDALADAALMLGGELVEERALGGERRILILAKVAPTPARFPRRAGIPAKRPLCGETR